MHLMTMPKLSPTMKEGKIVRWHKKEGDYVQEGELLLEIATDKATVEYYATTSGYLRMILARIDQTMQVGATIAVFTKEKDESLEKYQNTIKPLSKEKKTLKKEGGVKKPPEKVIYTPSFTPEPPLEDYKFSFFKHPIDKMLASPLAKKLAKAKGLDLSTVRGTGPGGRIMSRDLDLAQAETVVEFGNRKMPKVTSGTFEEVPLSPIRQIIAKRVQDAKTFIPHFYISQDVNAELLIDMKRELQDAKFKVTINDFVIRACALSLKEHPTINSGYNSLKDMIVRFKTIDIAIAVAVEEEIVTPILRFADYKNLGQISVEAKDLITKARQNLLKPHEYRGGSFTISNLGMFNITSFISILNPPQAAILAIGGIEDYVQIKKDKLIPSKKMILTLSCDHRVVDGKNAALFIKTIQKYLENPGLLLVS